MGEHFFYTLVLDEKSLPFFDQWESVLYSVGDISLKIKITLQSILANKEVMRSQMEVGLQS